MSVNLPNIKLKIGKYKAKRTGNKNVVRMDTAKEIIQSVGDNYAIVYVDFRKDVDFMVNCLKDVGIEDSRVYHGKSPQKAKTKIDEDFYYKEFQVLVATES